MLPQKGKAYIHPCPGNIYEGKATGIQQGD
jgi:hypothetical protein